MAFGCGRVVVAKTRHPKQMNHHNRRREAADAGTTDMNTLLGFLAGPSGKTSSMRVMSFGVVFLVMTTWAWVSVRKEALQPMDPEHMAIVLGAMGIKAAQMKMEGQKGKKDE